MPEPAPFAPRRGRKRDAIDGDSVAKRIRTGGEAQSRDLGALASSERDSKTYVARLYLRTSGASMATHTKHIIAIVFAIVNIESHHQFHCRLYGMLAPLGIA